MNGWQSNEWMKMRSMTKKIARGRSECVQRTGIVSEIFFSSWCSFTRLTIMPLLVSSVSKALLAEISVYYNSKKYLIMHKQLLILHWNAYRSHFYDIVTLFVTITTLWLVARQPSWPKKCWTIHVLPHNNEEKVWITWFVLFLLLFCIKQLWREDYGIKTPWPYTNIKKNRPVCSSLSVRR